MTEFHLGFSGCGNRGRRGPSGADDVETLAQFAGVCFSHDDNAVRAATGQITWGETAPIFSAVTSDTVSAARETMARLIAASSKCPVLAPRRDEGR